MVVINMAIYQNLKNFLEKNMDSFFLKMVALFFMTVDHFAKFFSDMPAIYNIAPYLHMLGRIAAPLFLFLLVYSARYTHNKKHFLFRLYIAAVLISVFECFCKVFLFKNLGIPMYKNIVFTFFYIVAYIYLIENIAKPKYRLWSILGIIAITILPDKLWYFVDHTAFFHSILDYNYVLGRDLLDIIIPNQFHSEYGLPFILLGIVMYFAKNKKWQCIFFTAFCLFWPLLNKIIYTFKLLELKYFLWEHIPGISNFMLYIQWFMILALPFMLLYNGKSDNRCKWFFYAYYPIHRNVLFLLSCLFV